MGLFKTALNGAVWTTVSTAVRSVVSIFQVSILTRFLEKGDFGIVAIATLFIGFSSIFLDLGISIGILHKQEIKRSEYSSLFWLNIISGIIITLVLFLAAPIIASAYKEPELVRVIRFLSFSTLLASIGNQHRIVQQKKLRFKLISIIEIATAILTIIVAATLAINGYGVYSLVYSTLFNYAFLNIAFLIIGLSQDANIYLHFNFRETIPYLKIGGYQLGAQTLDYFSSEIDTIIISATLGKETLGVYSLCKRLVVALYAAITPIYSKVLIPLISSIQNEKERVITAFSNVIRTVSILNFPVFTVVAICSPAILYVLYGSQYLDASFVLAILALHYGYLSKGNPEGSLQVAFGRTDVGLYWTICRIIIYSMAIYIGCQFSVEGIALSLLLVNFISAPIAWFINIKQLIPVGFWDYFKLSFYPLLVSLTVALPFYLVIHGSINVLGNVIVGILYLIAYSISSYYLFKESYIIIRLKEVFNKFFVKQELHN